MDNNQFEIYIDYDKNADKPERVFLSLAKLVSEFSSFDSLICDSLSIQVNSKIVLDKIENGSVKAFFRQAIECIDDEPLSNLDIKGIIGHVLVKGKYKLLDALKETPEKQVVDIKQLQNDIFESTKDIKVSPLQVNKYIPPIKLAKCLDGVNTAFGHLTANDRVKYITKDNSLDTKFNPTFSMAYEKTLLIEQNMINTYKVILIVKKPDLLSDSQWSFKYKDKPINAKIEDEDWLTKFHNREVLIQSKDSIECDLQIQTKEIPNAKTETVYIVTKVHRVIQYIQPMQLGLKNSVQ